MTRGGYKKIHDLLMQHAEWDVGTLLDNGNTSVAKLLDERPKKYIDNPNSYGKPILNLMENPTSSMAFSDALEPAAHDVLHGVLALPGSPFAESLLMGIYVGNNGELYKERSHVQTILFKHNQHPSLPVLFHHGVEIGKALPKGMLKEACLAGIADPSLTLGELRARAGIKPESLAGEYAWLERTNVASSKVPPLSR